jgi:hypothetical protein
MIIMTTLRLAERLVCGDSSLGPPGFQARFTGHCIGLDINELAFLARSHVYPLGGGT